MREDERKQLVQAWIEHQHADEGSPGRERLSWADDRLWNLTLEDPECAWDIILQILKADSSMRVLQNLSAGPLEDLLVEHGPSFIERVEETAKHDERLRELLGGVWQSEMSDDVWKRIQALMVRRW